MEARAELSRVALESELTRAVEGAHEAVVVLERRVMSMEGRLEGDEKVMSNSRCLLLDRIHIVDQMTVEEKSVPSGNSSTNQSTSQPINPNKPAYFNLFIKQTLRPIERH